MNSPRVPPGSSTSLGAHRRALGFIVLVGVVSLFADATYEGSRSIWGPFFGTLGATGAVVGVVAGCGELVGYGLRLFTGMLADRTRRYWTITIIGYVVNLLAVPALALVGSWPAAAALVITERIGKATRNPPRDAMLSFAAQDAGGAGWAFGLHEALDQAGATLGPLAAALILYLQDGFRQAFAWLLVPALAALATLLIARRRFPNPEVLATTPAMPVNPSHARRELKQFALATALIAAGYADFALISFHLARDHVLPTATVAVLYALANLAAGLTALVLGRWFDRRGFSVLFWTTVVAAIYTPLVFLGGPGAAVVGMALWGIGFGAHESLFRAAVANRVAPERRATILGAFNAIYGVAWCGGSVLLGVLYDVGPIFTVIVALVLQLAACPILWHLRRAETT